MFQTRDASFNTIKYAGRSRAIVLDNNDPLSKGRIIVDHPLLGETVWIPYLAVAGCFSVPEIGDVVYVECDAGFETHPVAWGNLNTGEDSLDKIPESFRRVTPTNRGLYSPGGHLIEMDEDSDPTGTDKGIRITTLDGSVIDIRDELTNNSITVETASGALIKIDGTNDSVEVTTAAGANLKVDGINDSITAEVSFGDNIELSAANGFQVDTPAAGGTHLSQKGGKLDLTSTLDMTATSSSGNVTVEASGGAKLKLGTGKVGLGGPAGELLAEVSKLADELSKLALADSTHIHPTAVGPSGPPTTAANMVAVQTAAIAIKTIIDLIKGGI